SGGSRRFGADCVYHFPEFGLLEFAAPRDPERSVTSYSVSEGPIAEMKAQRRHAEVHVFAQTSRRQNARAREEAMDRPPSATVQAYRQVYGRDPRGSPPA